MRFKITLILFVVILVIMLGFLVTQKFKNSLNDPEISISENGGGFVQKTNLHPLSIDYMRAQTYPGSQLEIEQTLDAGTNYSRYLVSYKSDGLKIYGLLTVPEGQVPKTGFPVIIFNHGYIPPGEYQTTEKYVAYTDAFSRNGYIVFKPDYRGHGNSQGNPEGGYYSPAYTKDVLNALNSLKNYPLKLPESENILDLIDEKSIGMWGHSMGGSLTLRSMVVSKEIKSGVIWAGVVANYQDLAKNWHRSRPFTLSERERLLIRPSRQALIDKYGDFDKNPTFWNSIAPITFVKDISGPIQIHHGTSDEEVPILFSQRLVDALKNAGKTVEFFTYEGDNHNLSTNLPIALQRSVEFFDKYLK